MQLPRRLLAFVSPGFNAWPDPLPPLMARKILQIIPTHSLHAAAACLADGTSPPYSALLVDPRWLTQRDGLALNHFQRHNSLSVWLLPTCDDFQLHPAAACLQGPIPWPEVRELLLREVPESFTAEPTRCCINPQRFLKPAEKATDKIALPNSVRETEIPMDSEVTSRYDESRQYPLLSDAELRALLEAFP